MRDDVVGTLRGQEMPPEEIRELLTTDDQRLVRRLLELHRERLHERLSEQLRTVAALERSLIGSAIEGRRVA
jgi:hypothetical protein